MNIENYMVDGANYQAVAVLALIRNRTSDNFPFDINVSRFNNCREQGYFLSVSKEGQPGPTGMTVAFAENRKSDCIVVYTVPRREMFDQPTNSFLYDTNDFVAKYLGCEDFNGAAEYIIGGIQKHFLD